jgi:transcriptional regulator with XRE-family HTH domain
MKDRIVQFIETEKLTAAEFADKIGVQRSSVSHVLNGRNNPGFSFIQKILETFPTINSRWLLTGQGELYEEKTLKASESKLESPDLFSTKTIEPTKKKVEVQEAPPLVNTAVNQSIPDDVKAILPAESADKSIKRVLIFYEDHTFEDFRPAN